MKRGLSKKKKIVPSRPKVAKDGVPCRWTDAVMLLVKTPGRCNSAESQLLAEPVSYTVRGAPDGVTRRVNFTPRVTPSGAPRTV